MRTGTLRTLGISAALVAAALVGGTLIGAVAAQDEPETDTDRAARLAEYCQTFLDNLADELGVTADAIVPAARSAAVATVQQLVTDEVITQERADRIIERIESASDEGCAGLGAFGGLGRWGHHGPRGDGPRGAVIDDAWSAAAESLGIEREALRDQLRDGASLQEIAEAEGVDYAIVRTAVLESVEESLAELSEERRARLLERLTEWLDGGGEGRFGRGPRG